jgi:hypothetical protein
VSDRAPAQVSTPAAVAIVTGVVLVVAYWSGAALLPRGAQEFAYFPMTLNQWPFDPMRGFTVEQAARHLGWTFLVGPGLGLIAFGLLRVKGLRLRPFEASARTVVAAGVMGCVLSAALLTGVFSGRAIVDDEGFYAWQAELLAEGRLADDGLPELHHEVFAVESRLGWTSKYLPGEAIVQIPGVWLGLPALAHLPLYALTVWAFFLAVRREAGASVAAASSTLLALSPFVLATTAVGLTHATVLACVTTAGLGLVMARGDQPWAGSALLAGAVGFGLWVRPQSVAAFGGVLALSCTITLLRRRQFGPLALAAGIGMASVGLIGAYNYALTGSATDLPWSLQFNPEHWGFGQVWPARAGHPYHHTPQMVVENTISQVVRLNQWAFGSPLSMGAVVAWWVAGRPTAGLSTWCLPTLAMITFMAGWHSPGVSETGPVYWYEAILPLALFGGHAWVVLRERWPGFVAVVLPLHLALATVPFAVEQTARLMRLVEATQAPIERVLADAPRPLVVIYELMNGETRRIGWLHTFFPRVSHRGDLVYFGNVPRSAGSRTYLEDVFTLFPRHACLYVRANPTTLEWEGTPCADAGALLSRPWEVQVQTVIPSTAMTLGWLHPNERTRFVAPAE